MRQKTIRHAFTLSGVGLHSGSDSSLTFSPAPANTGIVFIKDNKTIKASVDSVCASRRGTSLNGVAVVEHLLAAISSLGIDNLQIEITGEEVPVMDGSALPYAEALGSAGLKDLSEEKKVWLLKQSLRVSDGEAYLAVAPSAGFKIDFMIDFPIVGEQHFFFDPQKSSFIKEIAPARTFGYLEEYELLKEQGLALGASFENALILSKDGYVNAPRFTDEMVRHKILDLMGDLSLLGQSLQAEIKAYKSGHKLNLELVRQILTA
jgi:UDP-3-O-[3-hydroxymyristoyl] N-acetylglucosamine deacetylase